MSACIKACQSCFNQKGRTCKTFTDPAYQWKSGMCWGRVTDLGQFRQREKAVQEYTDRYGSRESYKHKPYVHEYVIGIYGNRKSLWFSCRTCEHCSGILYEDEKHEDYFVSADCKYNGRDIIKDKAFIKCPLNKWVIKRPKAI